jgi:hypothetical protein
LPSIGTYNYILPEQFSSSISHLFGDSGEDFIDEVENQELDVYNDQPLNDVDGIANRDRITINLPRN